MLIEAGNVESVVVVAVEHDSGLFVVFHVLVTEATILFELSLGKVIGALPILGEVLLVGCSGHVV